MLANDHAAIHFPARLDHHRAAIFQLPHGISDGFALFIGNQHAIAAALNVALMRRIFVEQAVHDRRALGVGEQFALITNQTTGRCMEHQTQAIAAGWAHFQKIGFALSHFLNDHAGMFFINVDHDFFDRLKNSAVFLALEHNARTRDAELEAFAAHGFDQNAKLQFAAARYDEAVTTG